MIAEAVSPLEQETNPWLNAAARFDEVINRRLKRAVAANLMISEDDLD